MVSENKKKKKIYVRGGLNQYGQKKKIIRVTSAREKGAIVCNDYLLFSLSNQSVLDTTCRLQRLPLDSFKKQHKGSETLPATI